MPKWYDNGTKKNKELSNKKLRKQEREWEDEKEWLERVSEIPAEEIQKMKE